MVSNHGAFLLAHKLSDTSPKMGTAILVAITAAVTALILFLGGFASYVCLPIYGVLALSPLINLIGGESSHAKPRSYHCVIATAIFFAYVLLRALLSPSGYVARADLEMVSAALIVYLLFSQILSSSRRRIPFVAALLILAVAASIVGGIQYFKGHNFMPFDFFPRPDYGIRASGFYGCPNHLAGFLEVMMFFGISLACWSRYGLLVRILAGYAAAMCAAGILLTGSRGGYASSIAGLATFGFLSLYVAGKWLRKEFWYAVAITAVLALGVGGYLIRSIVHESDFLQYRVDSVRGDGNDRIALAKAAIMQFQLNPIFGTGSRTYIYYGRQFRDPRIQRDPRFAHDDYLQFLAEYGIIGIAGFFVFLALHLRQGISAVSSEAATLTGDTNSGAERKRSGKKSRSNSAWRAVADGETERLRQRRPSFKGNNALALTIAAISSVAAYMIHSVVDFNLHIPANTCVMGFVFAILANPGFKPVAGLPPQTADRRWTWVFSKLMPAGLGVYLLAIAVPKWPAELYQELARRTLATPRLLVSDEVALRALELAERGVKYDSKNPALFATIGEAQFTLGILADDPADAARFYEASCVSYERAVKLCPMDVQYAAFFATSLDAVGRFDEAEEIYRRCLVMDPNAGSTHTYYAAHYQAQKKFDQAKAESLIALKLGNTYAEVKRLEIIKKEGTGKSDGPPPVSVAP